MGLEEYFMLLSFMIWIQRGSLGDEPRSDSKRRDSENYSYRSMRDTNGAALELSLFHSEKQNPATKSLKIPNDLPEDLPKWITSNSKFVETTPPACASGKPYCLYDKDYPEDKVHEIINNYHEDVHNLYLGLNKYSMKDYMVHDNFTNDYRKKGNFVCESEVTYIRPGWTRNWKREWVAVINTAKYPQDIRVETCKFLGKKCEYLPPCYKSFCVQRYSNMKLLCVDPNNPHQRPFVDVFEVPSACSCFVEHFVYF